MRALCNSNVRLTARAARPVRLVTTCKDSRIGKRPVQVGKSEVKLEGQILTVKVRQEMRDEVKRKLSFLVLLPFPGRWLVLAGFGTSTPSQTNTPLHTLCLSQCLCPFRCRDSFFSQGPLHIQMCVC